MSRREALGMVGAGVAASTAGYVQAQSSTATQTQCAHAMEDPREKYPKPPFKSEEQKWPGLARDKDLKPDHGENSYKGSGRLQGHKALITGGDSGMGRAAAIAYARECADVAINYFPTQ